MIPPAPKGIEYAQPGPEPLPPGARNVLGKYFPGLDLNKVQIDKQLAPNRGKLAYVAPAAKIGATNTIHIRPGIGLGYPDVRRSRKAQFPRPNTAGRAGTIFEFNFGRQIGTNISGQAATSLQVVVGPDGIVKTAFPF